MAKDAETSKPKHLDPTSEYYLSSQANSATAGDPDRTPTGRPWCTFCHQVGHTQEKCYRRLGIAPPGKGRGRGRGSPAMSQNAVGSSSGPLQASAAATQNNNPSLSQAQAAATSTLPGLTPGQMQRLITFLESSQLGTDSRVATDANYFVAFSNDICVLQDCTSKSPIGLGKMHRGVFVFQPLFTAIVASVSESESYELWHRRMRHPSSQSLIHLPTVSVVSPSLITICDLCCRAKHSRTVFPDSTSRAMDIFGLVHCDIWGPYRTNLPLEVDAVFFLGIPRARKGWRVYDLETNQVFFSRDVKFEETVFPFTTPLGPSPTPAITTFCPAWDCAEHPMASPPVIGGDTPPVTGGDQPPSPAATPSPGLSGITVGPDPEISSSASPPSSPTSLSPTLGRGKRQKKVPSVLKDYVCHTAQVLPPASSTPTNGSSGPRLTSWQEALDSKWVYKIKFNSDGFVERYKARVVVRGDTQVEGLNYTETFAPIAKMVSVRVFLAVAVIKNWELHQIDINNAFLHGDLHEEVYIRPPPGFSPSSPNKVLRLRKSLYGLRQSPRNWFAKLSTALRSYGFLQSHADHTLFTYRKWDVFLSVLVYVDDLILAGNNSTACSLFKKYLNDCFKLKDLGPLKYFLGIEAARGPRGLFLSQRKYELDILSEFSLSASKPAAFPMEQNHGLALDGGPLLSDPGPYRRLIGRLVYLTITRPDICYAVHVLSQFMQSPRSQHWDAALRVLRYLEAAPGQGLFLPTDSPLQIYALCDSNWASCPLIQRSVT
ncbi:hypothetical protein RJ639_045468 [Escallonia herrerae]|uniref:Reverse transcriptase Ty1/copia-type domain-containing protein n=1 Tax=Escallonia herrerae TaxID=1293975 RepID=A0AA88W6Y8_9ASTE|nr:hypothetical protein RJ639_045468 [Escallonia herrerae]